MLLLPAYCFVTIQAAVYLIILSYKSFDNTILLFENPTKYNVPCMLLLTCYNFFAMKKTFIFKLSNCLLLQTNKSPFVFIYTNFVIIKGKNQYLKQKRYKIWQKCLFFECFEIFYTFDRLSLIFAK